LSSILAYLRHEAGSRAPNRGAARAKSRSGTHQIWGLAGRWWLGLCELAKRAALLVVVVG